uniref:cytochrome P450 4c3-like n=1 Tax=Nicrophorus vespilloides TaxID=110193 RepID=UPI000E21B4B3|nr:cytochrome P450 4c3-like [Nicrophorus vespilloides]
MFGYIFFAFAALITYVLVKWYLQLYKYRNVKVPGPKPLPVLGNILEFGTNLKDILWNFKGLQEKYGGVFKLYLGPKQFKLVLTDPKYIQHVLSSSKHINKSDIYEFYIPMVEDGIVSAKGEIWRKNRKSFTQCFHVKLLDQFNVTFNSASDSLIKKLSKNVNKEIDINKFVSISTLETITETAMGIKFNDDSDKHLAYVDAVHCFFKIAMSRLFSLVYSNEFIFSFTEDHKIQQKYIEFARDYANSIISQRIEERRGQNSTGDEDEFGIKTKVAFIDQLLNMYSSEEDISYEEIRKQIVTFIIAGYDTVSTCLSFLLFELSLHPEIQEKIYNELVDLNLLKNDYYSLNEMNNMSYIECCIKEALRKYTPIPFYERLIEEDLKIEDVHIPKNTVVTIFAFGMHRSEEIYPDSDRFDPDRFLLENISKRHAYAYLPFSAGPRNCMGIRFAMYEMKCAIAKIIKHFHILPKSNFQLEVESDMVLTSSNGFPIMLKNR